jgi:hypothetical protein
VNALALWPGATACCLPWPSLDLLREESEDIRGPSLDLFREGSEESEGKVVDSGIRVVDVPLISRCMIGDGVNIVVECGIAAEQWTRLGWGSFEVRCSKWEILDSTDNR